MGTVIAKILSRQTACRLIAERLEPTPDAENMALFKFWKFSDYSHQVGTYPAHKIVAVDFFTDELASGRLLDFLIEQADEVRFNKFDNGVNLYVELERIVYQNSFGSDRMAAIVLAVLTWFKIEGMLLE